MSLPKLERALREHLGSDRPVDELTAKAHQALPSPQESAEGEVHDGAMSLPKLERVLREHLGADRPVDEFTAKAHQVLPPESAGAASRQVTGRFDLRVARAE